MKETSVVEVEEMRDDDTDDYASENEADEIITLRSKLSPVEIDDYIESLKSAAVHWYNTFYPLNNADLTSDESVWLDRLQEYMAVVKMGITDKLLGEYHRLTGRKTNNIKRKQFNLIMDEEIILKVKLIAAESKSGRFKWPGNRNLRGL
ncbi:hypothetical protein ACFLVE_03075 [Chloroflexota bacterium]